MITDEGSVSEMCILSTLLLHSSKFKMIVIKETPSLSTDNFHHEPLQIFFVW